MAIAKMKKRGFRANYGPTLSSHLVGMSFLVAGAGPIVIPEMWPATIRFESCGHGTCGRKHGRLLKHVTATDGWHLITHIMVRGKATQASREHSCQAGILMSYC